MKKPTLITFLFFVLSSFNSFAQIWERRENQPQWKSIGIINYKAQRLRIEPESFLIGVDLTNANLRGVDLRGAILEGAKLRGADLSFALLNDADFYGADLREVNFTGAAIDNASFNNANIQGAILPKALENSFSLTELKPKVEALGQNDITIGEQLTTLGQNDTAIGEQLTALGQNDTAIGEQLTALRQDDESILAEINAMKAQLQTLVASIAEKDAEIVELKKRPTLEQVRDARAGSVVLTVEPDGNNITLGLTIEQSDNLTQWTKLDGEMSRTIPIPEGKKFYRFALDK